jgi:hypothetical protein
MPKEYNPSAVFSDTFGEVGTKRHQVFYAYDHGDRVRHNQHGSGKIVSHAYGRHYHVTFDSGKKAVLPHKDLVQESRVAYIQRVLAETTAVVPTVHNAAKVSNAIIKHFGAKKERSYVASNPYADHRSLEHSISHKNLASLHNHLVSNGWEHETNGDTWDKAAVSHRYTHANGGRIHVTTHTGKGLHGGQPYNHVTVWGDKKAKPSTIPYYD